MKTRKATLIAALAIGLAASVHAQMGGMGPGMMRGGIAPAPPVENSVRPEVDASRANALLGYIQQQGLSCLQCHSIAGGGFGPSFAVIAASTGPGAQGRLVQHISQGFGRMPGGLASSAQAQRLAALIDALGTR